MGNYNRNYFYRMYWHSHLCCIYQLVVLNIYIDGVILGKYDYGFIFVIFVLEVSILFSILTRFGSWSHFMLYKSKMSMNWIEFLCDILFYLLAGCDLTETIQNFKLKTFFWYTQRTGECIFIFEQMVIFFLRKKVLLHWLWQRGSFIYF